MSEDTGSQGIIRTDNQALLSLLRDTTEDRLDENNMSRQSTAAQKQKKVYVDWPENSEDEEDGEFRFVSSRVDDYNDHTIREEEEPRKQHGKEYVLRDNSGGSKRHEYHQGAPVIVVEPNSERDVRESTIEDDEETLRREAQYQDELKRRVAEREHDIDSQKFPANRRQQQAYDSTVPRLDLDSLQTELPEESSGAPINISLRSPLPAVVKKKKVDFDTDSIDGDDSGDEELDDSLDFNPHRRVVPPSPAKHLRTLKKSSISSGSDNNNSEMYEQNHNQIVGVYSRDSFQNDGAPRPQPRGNREQPPPFVLHTDQSERSRREIDSNRYADENRLTNYPPASDRYEEQPVRGTRRDQAIPPVDVGSSRYEAQPDSSARYAAVTVRQSDRDPSSWQQMPQQRGIPVGYQDDRNYGLPQPQQFDQNYHRGPPEQFHDYPQQSSGPQRQYRQPQGYEPQYGQYQPQLQGYSNQQNTPEQYPAYQQPQQGYKDPQRGQEFDPAYQHQPQTGLAPDPAYQQQQQTPQGYREADKVPNQYQAYHQQQGPVPPGQFLQQGNVQQQQQNPFFISPQYNDDTPPKYEPHSAPYSHNEDDLGIYDDPGSSSAGDSEMKRRESESTVDLASELEAYQNRRQGAPRTLSHDSDYDNYKRMLHNNNIVRNNLKANKKPVLPKPLVSNFPFDEKPVVDYIEKNKQELAVGKKPEGSYNQAFKKRQTLNNKSVPRRDSFSKKPPLPNIRASNSTGSIPDALNSEHHHVVGGPPSSAEEVWNQKMRDLQDQKRQKSSGKKKQPKMFKKYNSDNRLNYDSEPAVAPRFIPPPGGGGQPHSYEYVDNNPRGIAAKPVWADNEPREQRVAVDINLKLMTPNQLNQQAKQSQQGPVNRSPPRDDHLRNYPPQQQTMSAGAVERQYQYSDPYRPDNEYLSPRSEDLNKARQSHTNPYSPLPPIPPHHDNYEQEEEGYLAQFQKQKHHEVGYKPYSMKDYKKLQLEIKLGGLGPNLDNETHKEKLEKKLRQAEYARQLREKNLTSSHHGRPPKPRHTPEQESVVPSVSKRQAAMEYAKTLKKTHSRSNSAEDKAKSGPHSPKTKPKAKKPPPPPKEETVDYIDLQRLLHQHAKDKENADAIRGTFRGVEGKA